MSKINDITISNFKFFGKEETIHLGGKHLLLYGENGSGKSSIFWGLYTLLEASLKDPSETGKYFLPIDKSDESLVNIYAPLMTEISSKKEHSNSYIKIQDDNAKTYELSLLDNRICGDLDAQESRKASDFINYQSIFKFQEFRNSETPDLYDVFVYSILPYVNFSSFKIKGKTLSNASSMWLEYQDGPGHTTNYKGDKILVYKNSPQYKEFCNFEAHFNSEFTKLIDYINVNAKARLKELGYDMDFQLLFSQPNHIKKDKKYEYTPFKIELKITNYNGTSVDIKKPHVFLNEAKLSALATAIRLTILDYRVDKATVPNALKVLVLDDLMISLDMGNRDNLTKLLLKKYTKDYQMLFLTHDRAYFNCVLNHLSEEDQKNNWRIMEMYETDKGDKKIPSIFPYRSALSKAYAYFKGDNCFIDYNACGNNQRQALEEIFKKQFKAYSLREDNGELVQTNDLMIAGFIVKAKAMYSKIGFDTDLLDELEIHRKQSLNPTSHHNPQSNFYKSEIERTFEIITLLKDHRIEKLVPCGSIITLEVECDDGTNYSYKLQIHDDILAYKAPHSGYFVNLSDKRVFCILECNGAAINIKTNGLTLQELYKETLEGIKNRFHKNPIEIEDAFSLFQYGGKTIKDILDERNV